jgi:hypothetical protein
MKRVGTPQKHEYDRAIEDYSKAIELVPQGTFHAVGARLLRSHANAIGLEPSFTIHDRQDSQDLMNLVRHERGLSDKDRRFPLKDTCLAIYSRAVNACETLEAVLLKQYPWCAEWKDELCDLFGLTSKPSRTSTCSITTTCCSTGASCDEGARAGEGGAATLRLRARR